MYVKNQKFLVLGVSKSGFAAGNYILDNGGICYFYEEHVNDKISESLNILMSRGAINAIDSVDEVLNTVDILIVSPGVPINHEVAVKAKKLGKRIIGEFEFGYLESTPKFIAVTGTNGKTTTVNMIYDIINSAGRDCRLVGNVGVPVTDELKNFDKNTLFVSEISSFQLETVDYFCPHVACVLNISPDHLERHYSMDNYVFLKRRILSSLTKSEYAVLNYDDEIVKSFSVTSNAQVIWVSIREKCKGAYYKDGKLFYFDDEILSVNELPFHGIHNVYNALFAIAVAKIFGFDNNIILQGLKSFKGVRHRIELIAEKDGVKYYDDSKATNTASTITAIEGISGGTVLILGGSEKGENYNELFNKIKHKNVKHVVLTGASKFNMLKSANEVGYSNISFTYNFENAVKIAVMLAESGDSVILSPACASFDCFKNFEERGNEFCRIVKELTC
ncbi:MAG: UDP-N-acetylmuramoyl-L-alanine--D-glutamate ligase [Clostridia bacterium]|nr:UDP-N-acetylmuramoyl-L-alanine--D-glutamate ligase [Clostridia bacterium]